MAHAESSTRQLPHARRAAPRPQVFYTITGLAGYLALGDDVAPNVLTSFTQFSQPSLSWIPLLANVLVLVHLVPAYQVRSCIPLLSDFPGLFLGGPPGF